MATVSLTGNIPEPSAGEVRDERVSIPARIVNAMAVPVLATLLALIIGGIVMALAIGQDRAVAFGAYKDLFVGAFGSWYGVQETLTDATPLMFAAFAVAFSFRGGLFNIGAEGQIYAGAIFSTWIGISLHWPPYLLLPVCIFASAFGGAMWALVPGLLKAYRGAHEVITTMMFNYIALYLMHYLLVSSATGQPGPLQGPSPGNPTSIGVHANYPVIVPGFLVNYAQLNFSFIVAIACGIIFWFVLSKTTLGYNIRATGFNIKAARYAGIKVGFTVVVTLLISGALAGLAGSAYIFGVSPYQLQDTWDSFSWGFDAIAVALLGKNTATGAILAAILFGALEQGGRNMQSLDGVDPHIIAIIQGLIIFFVGAESLVQYLGRGSMIPYLYGRLRTRPQTPAEGAAL